MSQHEIAWSLEKVDDDTLCLVVPIARWVMCTYDPARCVSLIKSGINKCRHLPELFDKEYARDKCLMTISNDVIEQHAREMDEYSSKFIASHSHEVLFSSRGVEREIKVESDSERWIQLILWRASVSAKDIEESLCAEDAEDEISKRMMWGKLKAGEEPDWYEVLGL
jgi:hypothetical protein